MNRSLRKLMPLIILAVLMLAAWLTGLQGFLTFESLQEQKDVIRGWAADHPVLALLGFALAYTLSVALSLPIASLLTLLGGFLFGKWAGTLIVVTSATAGAALVFAIAKTALGDRLRQKAAHRFKGLEANMRENAFNYLLFMRLVPLFPFWLVNVIPALLNIPFRTFILTTFIGIIPGSFVFVNVGEELGNIAAPSDILSPGLWGAFALLGLFALLPTVYKYWRTRKKGQPA